jgi:Matrixin
MLFNDPGDEIAGSFNCALGGVLAFGGPWFDSSIRGTFNATTYIRSAGADIVVNDGVSCFLDNDPLAARELFAHELGHTLGLAHSSENSLEPNATLRDALMYFAVHNDGRGASLRTDDLAGIRSLYLAAAPAKPAAPSGLTATATGLNQVRLVFTDNANNETDFRVEARPAGGVYAEVLTLGVSAGTGATPVILVGGLAQNTTYSFRIRAHNAGGFSAYSSEATATTFTTPSICTPGANRLCLNNNRFAVDVNWATGAGGSGLGTGVPLTPDTGYFWFFNSANVEMVVKVLDGCGLNGHYWVFAGGLTNTNVVMRVTDVTTGAIRTYTNPLSTPFQPIQDTSAFETCP